MWPKELRTLFADMWHQDYSKRPSFGELLPRMREIQREASQSVCLSVFPQNDLTAKECAYRKFCKHNQPSYAIQVHQFAEPSLSVTYH
jgi:hypothetical protein